MTTAPPCLPSPISTTGSLLSAPTSPCPTQVPPAYIYCHPHPRDVPPCSCHLHPFPHLVHRSPAALLSPAFLSPLTPTTMMIISHLSVTDAHHSWASVGHTRLRSQRQDQQQQHRCCLHFKAHLLTDQRWPARHPHPAHPLWKLEFCATCLTPRDTCTVKCLHQNLVPGCSG